MTIDRFDVSSGGALLSYCFIAHEQDEIQFSSCSPFLFSSRNYTVPDPPGLFDGHVWPMYVKHKNLMEDLNVDVGKWIRLWDLLVGNSKYAVLGICINIIA